MRRPRPWMRTTNNAKVTLRERAMTYPTTPGYVSGCETSKEAADLIEPSAGTIRRWVYDEIVRCGKQGATCDEIEESLDLSHQTTSARIRELSLNGNVEIIGARLTRTGRRARVYRVIDASTNERAAG